MWSKQWKRKNRCEIGISVLTLRKDTWLRLGKILMYFQYKILFASYADTSESQVCVIGWEENKFGVRTKKTHVESGNMTWEGVLALLRYNIPVAFGRRR